MRPRRTHTHNQPEQSTAVPAQRQPRPPHIPQQPSTRGAASPAGPAISSSTSSPQLEVRGAAAAAGEISSSGGPGRGISAGLAVDADGAGAVRTGRWDERLPDGWLGIAVTAACTLYALIRVAVG